MRGHKFFNETDVFDESSNHEVNIENGSEDETLEEEGHDKLASLTSIFSAHALVMERRGMKFNKLP